MVVSQQARKITVRISVICPHNRERLTFVGQDGVGWQCARHGGRNAMMKALNCPVVHRNLLADEGGIVVRRSSGLHRL